MHYEKLRNELEKLRISVSKKKEKEKRKRRKRKHHWTRGKIASIQIYITYIYNWNVGYLMGINHFYVAQLRKRP